MTGGSPHAWTGRVQATCALLVGAVAVAVHAPVLRAWFLNDDFSLLLAGRVFDGARLLQLSGREHFYRPLIELYFAAAVHAAGYSAVALHAVNLFVHAANGVLLCWLGARLARSWATGLAAALIFVTLPGYTEAVGWVAAITALAAGTWFLCAAIAHARYLSSGSTRDYVLLALVTFLAFATHESAVMLVPVLAGLERLGLGRARAGARGERGTPLQMRGEPATHPGPGLHEGGAGDRRPHAAVRYAPLVVMLAGYLLIAWTVNARNYVVLEGHYAPGWHAVKNGLDYIVSMYVGKRGVVAYSLIPLVILLVLWRGSPLARFALWWMLCGLAPVVWFTWGNASRYLYLPSIGFSLLLAEGVRGLGAWSARRIGVRAAQTVAVLLVLAISVRFAVFARQAANHFVTKTTPYLDYARQVRSATARPPAEPLEPGPGIDARYAPAIAELVASDPSVAR